MNPTTTLMTVSTKSSRSFSTEPIIIKLDNDDEHEMHVDHAPAPPSPTRPRITTKPLRRKKHLSIYRVSAPAQSPVVEVPLDLPFVQRPKSMVSPSSVVYESSPLAHAPTRPHIHSRTQSQPSNIRLGHPSRPYYSAIRKNMSRPNSPLANASTNPSRPTSMVLSQSPPIAQRPSFDYLQRIFDDTEDINGDEVAFGSPHSRRGSASRFSFGLGGFSSPPSTSNSGFSVSGEMEMRMALAALAREAHQQDPSFQFQETGRMQSTISWHVKKLGRGLKDLVRRKHDQ
ncbi:hypothetical protein B0H10DRAFT_2018525 [Mycena sp. CBHHK59/15]|nr:hypothetical protein B0H10DRAFT_2018525 [Mycena sp. CBHHK59/15]